MTNAWNHAKELAEKHSGGKYIKLQNDGDKVVGKFCGDPFAREVFWDGKQYHNSKPETGNAKASLRVSINLFSEGEMKVIDLNAKTFETLCEIRDKYGLDKKFFEIKRHGKKGDTGTRYTILPEKDDIDPALLVQIARTPLNDLTKGESAGEETAAAPPVDIDTAKAVAERVRALPRSDGEAFLAQFKIPRIRDLASADLPAALRFIDAAEAKYRPAAAPAAVDPFEV
jgi:hypothetical protein